LKKINFFEEKAQNMSEVPYYILKQRVKLTKMNTYYEKKGKNKGNNVLMKKSAISQEKQDFLYFFSEIIEIALN